MNPMNGAPSKARMLGSLRYDVIRDCTREMLSRDCVVDVRRMHNCSQENEHEFNVSDFVG